MPTQNAIFLIIIYLTRKRVKLEKNGKEVMVDKTWVFKKGKDGKLRIIVHKSALPFSPNS